MANPGDILAPKLLADGTFEESVVTPAAIGAAALVNGLVPASQLPPLNAQSTTFTGNGTQTVFSVANLTDNNPSNIFVVLNGVTQEPGSDYSVNATAGTVTLTSPLPASNKLVVTVLGLLPSPTSLSAEQIGALTATSVIDGGAF